MEWCCRHTCIFTARSQHTFAILQLEPLHSYLYFPMRSLNIQHFWKKKRKKTFSGYEKYKHFYLRTVVWVKKKEQKQKTQLWLNDKSLFLFWLTGGRFWFWFWFWLRRRMTRWDGQDDNTTRRQREREELDKETQVKTHKHNGNSDNLKNMWVRRPIPGERYMNQRRGKHLK